MAWARYDDDEIIEDEKRELRKHDSDDEQATTETGLKYVGDKHFLD